MKNQKKFNPNLRIIAAVLAAALVILVAVIGIIEIPKALSKDENVVVENTRFEEADSFAITKMEMTTYVDDGELINRYFVSLRGAHVVFMAEVTLDQYMYYDVGDNIAGTLIVENEKMNFELDEFGKSFTVLGYVGLAD